MTRPALRASGGGAAGSGGTSLGDNFFLEAYVQPTASRSRDINDVVVMQEQVVRYHVQNREGKTLQSSRSRDWFERRLAPVQKKEAIAHRYAALVKTVTYE